MNRADSLDLQYDAEDREFAEVVGEWADGHRAGWGVPGREPGAEPQVPGPLWAGLAELGVLGLGTPEGGGGATTIAAVTEQLGRTACPGPLAATFTAGRLLPAPEAARLSDGLDLVSLGTDQLMPWAGAATVFVQIDPAGTAWLCESAGAPRPVSTLAGEPWARIDLARAGGLGPAGPATALGFVASAAYLVGGGLEAVRQAADHVRERRQFGRPLGDFQAVSHPLADCFTRLLAAQVLVKLAAWHLDHTESGERRAAVARRSAAEAALAAVYTAHQAMGAYGYTVEAPLARLTLRLRQVASTPPLPKVRLHHTSFREVTEEVTR